MSKYAADDDADNRGCRRYTKLGHHSNVGMSANDYTSSTDKSAMHLPASEIR